MRTRLYMKTRLFYDVTDDITCDDFMVQGAGIDVVMVQRLMMS